MDAKLKRTTLRIPHDLYDRIVEAAGNDMTLNTLVTMTLLDAFPTPSEFDFAHIVNQWRRRIEATLSIEEKQSLVDMANREIRTEFDGSPMDFILLPDATLAVKVVADL